MVFENMAASFFEAEYRGHIICGPPPSTSRPPLKSLIPQSQNVPFEGAEIGKKDVPLVSEEAKKIFDFYSMPWPSCNCESRIGETIGGR